MAIGNLLNRHKIKELIKTKIIYQGLLSFFKEQIHSNPLSSLDLKRQEELPVDYFDFYNSVSSVYSSKIEGEEIDYDSFFKYKFLKVPYEPDYTKRSNDLFKAYEYIQNQKFTKDGLKQAHAILSTNLLPEHQRGKLRNNPMYVLGEEDKIEYVACDQYRLSDEYDQFIVDTSMLFETEMDVSESFYYASMIHLTFVKIHPFQDGNGRMGRLLEKWFLLDKLGDLAHATGLEKNYYEHRADYYNNIKKLGLEYETLNYSNALDFLLMTINSIK